MNNPNDDIEYVTETYEEMMERALEIAEDEGRPFDHVIGEILGGLR